MAKNLIGYAFGIGVIVLVIALVLPSLIAAPGADESMMEGMSVDDTEQFGPSIEITVNDVNTETDEVTVSVEDSESGESVTVAEGGTETVSLDGGDVDVTIESIEFEDAALVSATYESTHGWSDESQMFADNLDLLFVAIAFIIVGGLLMVVIRE